MVNEDIVTGLKNAVARGESLQNAIQILINSGYNPVEVNEASRYIQGGVISDLEPKKDEYLMMIQNKIQNNNLNQNSNNFKPKELIQYNSNSQNQKLLENNPIQEISVSENKFEIKEKKSFKKEIILLIILLFLIGILAITVFFKDSILNFLSA